jgi:hypothetical protein
MKCWSVYMLLTICQVSIHSRTSFAFMPLSSVGCHLCTAKHFSKNADGEDFGITEDNEDSNYSPSPIGSVTNLDMKTFQLRKHKRMLQSRQQRWHQPPNPLLEDPIEFVQAILMALQQRQKNCTSNGALCLLQSSTPSWRRILLNSGGAPSDATNDQVAPTLQNALERANNQFAILTMKLDENSTDDSDFSSTTSSVQKSWHFPSDPVIFEGDNDVEQNEREEGERILDNCWIESRLRSPKDDQLLAVVGWSLQRRQIIQEQHGYNSSDFHSNADNFMSCWLLDGIDWQDFRDEFRPGIGRDEWERICG